MKAIQIVHINVIYTFFSTFLLTNFDMTFKYSDITQTLAYNYFMQYKNKQIINQQII